MHSEPFDKEILENYILAKTPIKYAKITSITKVVVHPATNFIKYHISGEVSPYGKVRRMLSKRIQMNIDVFEADIKAHQRNGRNYQEAFYNAAVCTFLGL